MITFLFWYLMFWLSGMSALLIQWWIGDDIRGYDISTGILLSILLGPFVPILYLFNTSKIIIKGRR
jgi:hypothetical protein